MTRIATEDDSRYAKRQIEVETRSKHMGAKATEIMQRRYDAILAQHTERFESTRQHLLAPTALRLAAYLEGAAPGTDNMKALMGNIAHGRLKDDDRAYLVTEVKRIQALAPSDSLSPEDAALLATRDTISEHAPAERDGDVGTGFRDACESATRSLKALRDTKDTLEGKVSTLKDKLASVDSVDKARGHLIEAERAIDAYDGESKACCPEPNPKFVLHIRGDQPEPMAGSDWDSISDEDLHKEASHELERTAHSSRHIAAETDEKTGITSYRIAPTNPRRYHPKTNLSEQIATKTHENSLLRKTAVEFDRANNALHTAEKKLEQVLAKAESANPGALRHGAAALDPELKKALKQATLNYKRAKIKQRQAANKLKLRASLLNCEVMNSLGAHLRNNASSAELEALMRAQDDKQQDELIDALHQHYRLQTRRLTDPDLWQAGEGIGGSLWKGLSKVGSVLHGKPVGYYNTRRDGLTKQQRQVAFEEYIKEPPEGQDNPAFRHFKELSDAGLDITVSKDTTGGLEFKYSSVQLEQLEADFERWKTKREKKHKTEHQAHRAQQLAATGKATPYTPLTKYELQEMYHNETGRRAPPSSARVKCVLEWHTEKFGDYCVKNAAKYKKTPSAQSRLRASRQRSPAMPGHADSSVGLESKGEEKEGAPTRLVS